MRKRTIQFEMMAGKPDMIAVFNVSHRGREDYGDDYPLHIVKTEYRAVWEVSDPEHSRRLETQYLVMNENGQLVDVKDFHSRFISMIQADKFDRRYFMDLIQKERG